MSPGIRYCSPMKQGPASVAPQIISDNLVFNFDISNTAGITVVNTDKISSFESIPDTLPSATQGTDANRPIYDNSVTFSGFASIKYDRLSGSTGRHFAVNCGESTLTSWTFYIVCRPYAVPNNFDAISGKSNTAETGHLILYTGASSNLAVYINNVGLLHLTGSNTFENENTYLVCWTYNGSTSTIYIDDVVTAKGSANSSSRYSWGPACTLGMGSGFSGIKLNVAQQVLYSAVHDQSQREQMQQYLARWS